MLKFQINRVFSFLSFSGQQNKHGKIIKPASLKFKPPSINKTLNMKRTHKQETEETCNNT